MRELREVRNCVVPNVESKRLRCKEEANQRTPKSDKEQENIYSAEELKSIRG